MSHAAILDVVARIHVDMAFRDAFMADPQAALLASGPADLDETARVDLSRLDARTVDQIGRIADYHRWMRLVDYLPWLSMELRPGLAAPVTRYLRSAAPELLGRDDALGFCRFLEREPRGEPAYLGELARHERLRIATAWGAPEGEARDVLFDFPIQRIAEALAGPGWPDATPAPVRLTFKKVPGIPSVIVRSTPG